MLTALSAFNCVSHKKQFFLLPDLSFYVSKNIKKLPSDIISRHSSIRAESDFEVQLYILSSSSDIRADIRRYIAHRTADPRDGTND